MNSYPDRKQSLELLNTHVKSRQMIIHSLSVEALMLGLGKELANTDSDLWAATGLMHDLDYEITEKDSSRHAIPGSEMLRDNGYPEQMVTAVLSHNGHAEPASLMARALIVADALSGLVYAGALMRPDRLVSSMNVKSLKKKYKSKGFAAGANREHMALCEEWLGIPLERAMEIAIQYMGAVEQELDIWVWNRRNSVCVERVTSLLLVMKFA